MSDLSGLTFDTAELDRLVRDLERGRSRIGATMRRIHSEAGSRLEQAGRSRASGYGGVRAKAAPSLSQAATERAMEFRIGGAGYAAGAFFGSIRYRRFPGYVGPDVESIYGLGDAFDSEWRDLERIYQDRLAELIE